MLMRFDPFREVDRLTGAMLERAGVPRMPMDAYRHGDSFLVHFDLPGIDPASIEVTVEKNVLAVRAERTSQLAEDDEVVVVERPQGTFGRQVFLGEGLDPEGYRGPLRQRRADPHHTGGRAGQAPPSRDCEQPNQGSADRRRGQVGCLKTQAMR
jgi:HSP20 family protein